MGGSLSTEDQKTINQKDFFASCGSVLFCYRETGIEVIPGKLSPETKRFFLELKKQKTMQMLTHQQVVECEDCRTSGDARNILFPACRKGHFFLCEGCRLTRGRSRCTFRGCEEDFFLVEEYNKTLEEHKREWLEKRCPMPQATETRRIDSLTLRGSELPARSVLLHSGTTVTLENIALSDALFSKLLTKTKLVVSKNVFVFKHFDGRDCIREGPNVERSELCFPLVLKEEISLLLENITRIPDKSINIGNAEKLQTNGFAINILPKLVRNREKEMERFELRADEKEHVSEILSTRNTIDIGKVKKVLLENYAINILPKLVRNRENVIGSFGLRARDKRDVSEILSTRNTIDIGRENLYIYRELY
ncbi:MAG: uncharacterized protein A8A55_3020 [Amphiamblys sp. WSBS2006]|nr:MAG: uncharacterized protein A8A55_3020 [Amphiamblys sp. WSBS2006]